MYFWIAKQRVLMDSGAQDGANNTGTFKMESPWTPARPIAEEMSPEPKVASAITHYTAS